jgi:hypothetical protein
MVGSKELFTREQQRIWDEMSPEEQLAALEGYKWATHNLKIITNAIFDGSAGNDTRDSE